MTASVADLRPQAERVSEYFAGPAGQECYFALLHYTERLLRSMHWCISTDDDSMPGGAQARDVVHDTVQSLLTEDPTASGYRKLPAEVGVDAALKMIVWSKVNHAAEDAENTRREDHLGVSREGRAVDHLETDAPMWEPSQANLSPQQQAHAAARCTRFIEYCRKDKVVRDMLIIIRDRGIDRPAERLAKELGIRPADVYVARKRLGTLVRQFRKATMTT
jgi:hypothetical protein